ncbi:hypothetical protein BKA56DRAFT_567466 [Ilyonectria sp. MPI-CAGE-AT-0026]|nr:hypothetical protein BKA56DRAFT_567466 [Ilyonectria sp. MPI-CAGE-AT-0026]
MVSQMRSYPGALAHSSSPGATFWGTWRFLCGNDGGLINTYAVRARLRKIKAASAPAVVITLYVRWEGAVCPIWQLMIRRTLKLHVQTSLEEPWPAHLVFLPKGPAGLFRGQWCRGLEGRVRASLVPQTDTNEAGLDSGDRYHNATCSRHSRSTKSGGTLEQDDAAVVASGEAREARELGRLGRQGSLSRGNATLSHLLRH